MRPKVITQTGVGTSAPFIVNWRGGPGGFSISVATVATGTVTYNIEYCFDDLLSGATATWFTGPVTGATTSQVVNITTPCTAIRVNVTAGTGTATATIHQITSGI